MSDPIAAWTRLTAQSKRLLNAHGGQPWLTPADVTRLLQGLERGPFLMGMAVINGAVECVAELEQCMCDYAQGLADGTRNSKPWPRARLQEHCRRLAGMAIYEAILQRPIRCPRCHGSGFVVLHGQGTPCVDVYLGERLEKRGCNNSGGRPLSRKLRANLAGFSWNAWREGGWNWRYELLLAEGLGWQSDAVHHMLNGLDALYEA